MLLSERDGNSRTGQSEEADSGKIASNIQWGRESVQEQRGAPRLSLGADRLAAFEPVRRADLRRHGRFRRQQRGVFAPIHASRAPPAQPRRFLAAVPGSFAAALARFAAGLGEGDGGGGRPAGGGRQEIQRDPSASGAARDAGRQGRGRHR